MSTLQLPLFDDLTPVPARAAAVVEATASARRTVPAAPEECEEWLFDSAVMLRLAIDEALEDGRFDDARRCYESLAEQWGPDPRLGELAFLDRIELPVCDDSPERSLRQWLDIVPLTAIGGRRAWRGLTRRLLEVHGAGALVAAEPRCLVPLANTLADLSRESPALAAQARDLVRDALLGGRDLRPDDFSDVRIRDLLAEHFPPMWLASLGAIRRLWSAPAVDERTGARLLAAPLGARRGDLDEAAAARHFWDCLRTAWSPVPEALRQEARRRMKGLNPELHLLAMQRTPAERAPVPWSRRG